jgi:hypothetical protein
LEVNENNGLMEIESDEIDVIQRDTCDADD